MRMTRCRIRTVMRSCLARVPIGAIAVIAWLFLSTVAPGTVRNEVAIHAGDVTFVSRALPEGADGAYGPSRSRRLGGIEHEADASTLRHKAMLSVQCRSVALGYSARRGAQFRVTSGTRAKPFLA
jgi:hypothetical protein